MDLFEYQGKMLLGGMGVPVPGSKLARTAAEARQAASELGGPVVVKAQVQTGGRGKAGGIKRAKSPAQAESAAATLPWRPSSIPFGGGCSAVSPQNGH